MNRARWPAPTLALALILAACGTSTSPGPGGSIAPSSSGPATSGEPAASASPGPGTSPGPSAGASGEPASGSPGSSPGAPVPSGDGAAAACSGSAENRDFFAQFAASVDWPVYCAVLPSGWFVEAGSYRLAAGGRLEVTYRGPGGAHFTLREGTVCTDGVSACSPHDLFQGPAAFGDRQGELGSLGDGFVLYVDAGSAPSWTAEGTGLGGDEFAAYCAALVRVGAAG